MVGLEVAVGEGLKVGKGGGGDVTLPLQVALAGVDQAPELRLSLHEGHECLAKLQLVAGDGRLASGKLLAVSAPGGLGHLPHIGGEGDHVVILVDVVHDLHLEESLDSAMFSLSCLMPLPPVLGVPFLSMTLSHSFLAAWPPASLETRSMTTGNSPRNRGSLAGSITYLSIFSRSRLTPGTVSTRPSKEALIWNSLKRQAMTEPVVALERPTWSLTMMGVLMEVPTRVLQMMSKSASLGAAELQTGTLMCTRPGKSAFRPSMVSERVFRSLTSTSFSSLLMVRYFSLPPFSLARPSPSCAGDRG